MPLLVLALVFIGWPFLEIATFIAVGGRIGILPTLALILMTGILGAVLLRREGPATLMKVRRAIETGDAPEKALSDAAMVAIGGVLLILPGFVTDVVGLALFLPPVRAALRALVGRSVKVRATVFTNGEPRRDATPRVIELDRDDWSSTAPNRDDTPWGDPRR